MEFKNNKAIYLQIVDRVFDEILFGHYAEEQRIPSVREYAVEVQVNANTVMRSYEFMQAHRIIYMKRGLGYFVAPDARELILSLRRDSFLKDEVDYFFKQIYSLNISAEELADMYREFTQKQK